MLPATAANAAYMPSSLVDSAQAMADMAIAPHSSLGGLPPYLNLADVTVTQSEIDEDIEHG